MEAVITSGTASVAVLGSVNGGWYANAPLNADGTATALAASFEGGLVSSTNAVSWSALNVVAASGTTMAVRTGDSMRLTGYPAGSQASGTVSISILSGTTVVTGTSTAATAPFIYTFATTGTYSVQASWNGSPAATVTVQVEAASFGSALFAYVNSARTWKTPALGTGLEVDWDTNLSVTNNAPPAGGGCSFQVLPLASGTWYAVARLGPGGPILARGEVDAYSDYNATATGDTQVVATNPDGSYLVQCSIVINALPPGGYVVVQIGIAGATFTDGTTKLTLTAADFADGVAAFEINWDNPHSVCHTVFIYDASGNLVGKM